MKKAIIIIIGLMISLSSYSQAYFTAGGARFGTDWGISIQQKVLKNTTVEGIFQSSLFREETMITLLAEQHFPIITKRINLYLGVGYHQGFVTSTTPLYPSPYGISVIGGAEITLFRFAVSYDYKPAFNLYGGENSWYSQSAISVRYVLIKQNAFEKRRRKKERHKRQKDRKERREDLFNK